jgi:molybdopterin converting factor small subunit
VIKCQVELYGLSRETIELQQLELELMDGANLKDLVAKLRHSIPALEGRVIRAEEDRLTEYYAFNINGYFYANDSEFLLRNGEHIILVPLATGG